MIKVVKQLNIYTGKNNYDTFPVLGLFYPSKLVEYYMKFKVKRAIEIVKRLYI